MSGPLVSGATPRAEVTASIPVARWGEAIDRRISRRAYGPEELDPERTEALARFCEDFRPFDGARAALVRHAPPEMFTGWLLGRYGKVSSPSALVFVGDAGRDGMPERVGYTGEGIVLEAVSQGLGTCWIGGGVKRERVRELLDLDPGERVYSISALGTVAEVQGRAERFTRGATHAVRPRRDIAAIAPGADGWPAWARAGLDAARVAPSASNRQPWRFAWVEGGVEIAYAGADTPVLSKRMDCGIAMLHFEVGARAAGTTGVWTLRRARKTLARWTPGQDAE